MSPARKTRRSEPALKAFGRQMKRVRIHANLTQEAIAGHTNTSDSFVSQVETGKKRCSRNFATTVDQVTGAGGALLELYDDLTKEDGSPVPLWFDWPQVEAEADMAVTWQPSVVPGLLQTPAYAAQFLSAEAVEARIARQAVLTRTKPAPLTLVVLLNEQVLTHGVGSTEIMRAQLEHLIELSEWPNITIQLVPNSGRPAAFGGAFILATMNDRSEIAYLETTIRGITTDSPDDLAQIAQSLVKLRAKALPEDQTRDAIRKVIEEKWT
ncbi:helix-turn-helix domain-containing protein [Actinomadura hibisca]|uniref:helix-turn-helix domain-containing protein n=1 Tax=Actinomadura hibisca TaxID=68565 RepID=UPI00082EE41C|nr:helix-turn-helix transcriptional regulator [Actinomadura hibisca]